MKLNLGSGFKHLDGYINVDQFPDCNPDMVVDLEQFPLPWDDNSIDEIVMDNVLEHIGQLTPVFLKFIQELYRICKHDAVIHVMVPHPRHDCFLIDPTHCRVITPEGMSLFDKSVNEETLKNNQPSTPLGLYLNVDFKIENTQHKFDNKYIQLMQMGKITDINPFYNERNNVVIEVSFDMRVKKCI